MNSKNEVFEYLIDQLRQQVNNNQCEDLAHEVQSLKNQLRDASAQIKELTCALDCAENEVMCLRSIVDLDPKGAIGYIRRANSAMTDTMRHQYLSKALEELGCKDESCWIEWSGGACPVPCGELVDVIYRDGGTLYGLPADKINDTERDASGSFWRHDGAPNDIVRYRKASAVCINCGATQSEERKHEWEYYYPDGRRCAKCGWVNL